MSVRNYKVLGLLSGSSLDGTDLALCNFNFDNGASDPIKNWSIIKASTLPYNDYWLSQLRALPTLSAKDLVLADTALGHYYGRLILEFLGQESADLISSHGHTIFHFPHLRTTTQIGDGAAIAMETGLDTVSQLRSVDIAYGAQGAPLAPLGDKYLFPGYSLYLNLGGIANITVFKNRLPFAYDICPINQILNALANIEGMAYDADGAIAASGQLIPDLLTFFQSDTYLNLPFPKSLDNTWVQDKYVLPALRFEASVKDRLFTSVEFMAKEIGKACDTLLLSDPLNTTPSLYITGGGAFNQFLIQRISYYCPTIQIILPEPQKIEFKEASFIALAGLFRYLRLPNLFASVTGAPIDTINGAIFAGVKSTLNGY